MGVVFLGLILLALVLMALNRLFAVNAAETRSGSLSEEPPEEPPMAPAAGEDATTIVVGIEQAAAIAAVVQLSGGFGSENPRNKAEVTSSAWRLQGRGRLMASREMGRKRRNS